MKPVIRHNKGMAMLMALVMMAIASALAIGIWYNSQLSFARIHNLQKSYQSKHYAQGLLLWASDILRQDYATDQPNFDTNQEPWLRGIQGMAVEDAILSGTLVGLNNRFNVNNVIINGRQSSQHVAYLRRLLLLLELDVNIADKIIDWIDADQVPQPNGAEDFVYLAKSPGYQTSGHYFKHIEELALLDGLSQDDFNRLSPYISALPVKDRATRMNVNTMPPVLFSALSPIINRDMAVKLFKDGNAQYQTIDEFLDDPVIRFKLSGEREVIEMLISTQTMHLQASSLVQMEGSEFVQFALLKRFPAGDAQVISRALSSYLPKPLVN